MKKKLPMLYLAKVSSSVGPEGFQRAIGKPFGRARRRETLCVSKNAYIICKNDAASYFVNNLTPVWTQGPYRRRILQVCMLDVKRYREGGLLRRCLSAEKVAGNLQLLSLVGYGAPGAVCLEADLF